MLCGREREVETIVENCGLGRLTVVTSQPDMGITSLLRAGAIPALRRSGFVTVLHSDWEGRNVAARLRAAVTEAIQAQADGAFVADGEMLAGILSRARPLLNRPVAIVLDQWEEYLLNHAGTDLADSFDAEFAKAVNARDACFVLGLHDNAVPAFERFSQSIPFLLGHRVCLEMLSADAAEQLVVQRGAEAGMEVETEAARAFGSAAPIAVSLAADRLFAAEAALGLRTARLATLTANGGTERLIAEALDPALNDLGTTHGELLFRWFPLLVSPDGARLRTTEKALLERSGKWNQFAATLLPALLKAGLLRTVSLPSGIHYDLSRALSATVLRDWWTRKEADLIARERAKFRVRSLSIAAGAIIAAYVIYAILGWKQT